MAPVFPDRATFETLFTRLFAGIEADDPDGLDPLVQRRMVIRFAVDDPDVEMWVDGRRAPVRAGFEPMDVKPTLTASLSGPTLHELLLGTLPLGRALRSRRLKVKGSKLKAMRLEALLHACQAGYPALAEELLAASD